ncbi:aldo/keto reductase [Paenibacillus sp. GD4]|uniref:aldo/keto reductase n=1 Tax=Paenibacillus sp. GD4 TaxID=3068890 RepID=UPI0027967724|nr:aldo/keto reductase [Paenibacillus sp. GD4]MDQ1910578.1 aldo/keto reductase [Paenibacillus sp. GD4]
MQTRQFGTTGLRFPILSFGAQRIVDAHGCSEEEAIRIVHRAIDEGITYFDTAPSYSKGQSEERLGKALSQDGRRNRIHLATKTHDRTRDGSWRLLEESLKRLQTDHVDEWRLHNVASMEELDRCFAKDGAMQAMREAKEQGLVKLASISGHTNPDVQITALQRYPFDSALVALSVVDAFLYSFEHEFLPVAAEQGTAVIGMKVLGLGKLATWYEQALRYTWSLPISTAIIGMETMEQLERNLEAARSFQPLTEIERALLWKETAPLIDPGVMKWKAAAWESNEWYIRQKTTPTEG